MKTAGWLALVMLALAALPAQAVDRWNRTDSSTRQFTIYCDDTRVRQRVASFAEEVKSNLADLLGERRDGSLWQTPIIITIDRPTTMQRTAPPVELRPVQSDFGFKIEITVRIGHDPSDVHLEKQIVRALLIGFSYAPRGLTRGDTFYEAPWWVLEGAMQIFRRRSLGIDTGLFKRLVETGQLPPISEFLQGKPDDLGPAALAIDRACAMALVEFLVEQPGGRDSLAGLVRAWPHGKRDPLASLLAAFPSLGDEKTIQRWWTVSLARLAASDRHEGLTLQETEAQLSRQLTLDLPIDKTGQRRTFQLHEYREYAKIPQSRAALLARQTELVALSARANALFRPVVAEYEQIVALLARGKTRGIDERFARVAAYRRDTMVRLAQIDDYMNWFEATQLGTRSGMFDSYLKTAAEIEAQEQRASERVTKYLDQLEKEL